MRSPGAKVLGLPLSGQEPPGTSWGPGLVCTAPLPSQLPWIQFPVAGHCGTGRSALCVPQCEECWPLPSSSCTGDLRRTALPPAPGSGPQILVLHIGWKVEQAGVEQAGTAGGMSSHYGLLPCLLILASTVHTPWPVNPCARQNLQDSSGVGPLSKIAAGQGGGRAFGGVGKSGWEAFLCVISQQCRNLHTGQFPHQLLGS